MGPFKVVHSDAGDGAAESCVRQLHPLPEGANLGFLYVTDLLADRLEDILAQLKESTGIAHWVGGVGMGICAADRGYFARPAMAVMAAAFPEDSYRVIPTIAGEGRPLPARLKAWIDRVSPAFGIVHGDSSSPETPAIVEALAGSTASFLVGGLTSSRGPDYQVADSVTGGGVSGVLFAPDVEVATGLTQGCAPIGPSHLISEGEDNIIIGLDGRRALDVFEEDLGEPVDQGRIAGIIHAAFPVEGSDTGDYVVRNLIGIDSASGWLAVACQVPVGGRVMFVARDAKSAEADLAAMLDKLKNRLPKRPRGGVYVSCIARGPSLFGSPDTEAAMIRDVLGDFPLIGFYANGEISNARLYTYTGVLTLFV